MGYSLAVQKKTVLLGVTGSIAAYRACDLIRAFQDEGICVDVIMTKEAQEFITPLTLESILQHGVYTDMFDKNKSWEIEHISLAKKADVVLIAPATANIIGKIAHGIYDDLLTCVVAATRAKIIFAPAMNENMYNNPVVQKNIKELKDIGMKFTGPRVGKLCCGEVGIGCLEEVDKIVKVVKEVMKNR